MSEAELGPGVNAGPEAGSATEQGPGTAIGSEAELGTAVPGAAVPGTAVPGTAVPGTAAVGAGPERTSGGGVKLVLWRHGQTRWNAERRFQGQSDVPLDAKGHQQAQRAARLLAALRPHAIYSSDLTRAASTADRLAELTGVAVQLDKDLRERHGGSWEGLTDVEIRTRYPAAYAAWIPPDGEPVATVAERAADAFERVADSLAAGSLAVVVSHGAAISLGISRLLGLPEKARVLGGLDNCAWSVLGRRAGRWRLLEHNVGRLPEPVAGPEPGGLPPGGSLPHGAESEPRPGAGS